MKINFSILLLLLLLCGVSNIHAQTVDPVPFYSMLSWDTSPYKSYRFTRPDKEWINFRLLFPNGYDSTANADKKYPLTIILHGAGESARNDWKNPDKKNTPYPPGDPRIDNNDHHLLYGGKEHLEAVKDGRFPGFVLFPQNFYGTWISDNGSADSEMYRDLSKTLDLLEYLINHLQIDPDRIIIQGLSNGAAGTWYAAYKRPDLFAAIMPMSAHGDPAMASNIVPILLWVFQGQTDNNPSPHVTEKTVDTIIEAGGKVKYTLYPETGHNTWNKAYQEPEFFTWMLAQNKEEEQINKKPMVEAGQNQILLVPKDSTILEGTASDEDGTLVSYLWEKMSGPNAVLQNPEAQKTKITELEEGSYVFRFTATDNYGGKGSSELTVLVTSDPLETALQDLEYSNEISLYPNPFSDILKLKITSNTSKEFIITFFNPQGKRCFQTSVAVQGSEELVHSINLLNKPLPPGIYLVQIQSKKYNFTKKVTVIKKNE